MAPPAAPLLNLLLLHTSFSQQPSFRRAPLILQAPSPNAFLQPPFNPLSSFLRPTFHPPPKISTFHPAPKFSTYHPPPKISSRISASSAYSLLRGGLKSASRLAKYFIQVHKFFPIKNTKTSTTKKANLNIVTIIEMNSVVEKVHNWQASS